MQEFLKKMIADFSSAVMDYACYENNILVIELDFSKRNTDTEFTPDNDPVKLACVGFQIIEQGSVNMNLNYRKLHVPANHLLHMTEVHVVENVQFSRDARAHMIMVKKEFLPDIMGHDKPFPLDYILSIQNAPFVSLQKEQVDLLLDTLRRLRRNIKRTDHLFRKTLVHNDFASFSLELGDMIHKIKQKTPVHKEPGHKESVIHQFVLILQQYGKTEHAVSFYADKLCMSSQNLTRILKELSGDTVNKWIARVIITEARILLKNENLTIQRIAAELNFADQASFSKFFKKHCGVSPQTYRMMRR